MRRTVIPVDFNCAVTYKRSRPKSTQFLPLQIRIEVKVGRIIRVIYYVIMQPHIILMNVLGVYLIIVTHHRFY